MSALYAMQSSPLDPISQSSSNSYDSSNAAPDPRIVDVPGNAIKVSVDGGVADGSAGSGYARSTVSDGGVRVAGNLQAVQSSYGESANYAMNIGVSPASSNQFERNSNDAQSSAMPLPNYISDQNSYINTPAAPTVYRQEQGTIIEEQRRSQLSNADSQEQAQRSAQSQIHFAGMARNQNGVPMSLPTSNHSSAQQSNATEKTASGAAQGATEETQNSANKSLAEQIIYQNIRNKQRKIEEMSEEELELMRKLGYTQDPES